MELRDALRRIANRKALITMFVVGACAVALLLTYAASQTYTSSTRLMVSVPVAPEQGVVFADAARAIVTSPSRVDAAIESAGGEIEMPRRITVEPIGGSGAVILSVTHSDPDVAVEVASELATGLASEGLHAGGPSDDLAERAQRLERAIETLNERGVGSADADDDGSTSERLVLEEALADLEAIMATTTPRPAIIDPAVRPATPDPRPVIPNALLGCLVGLTMGVGIAAVIELYSPRLVSAREVARVIGVPALGDVSQPFDKLTLAEIQPLATRLQLAARYADVNVVEFFAESDEVELEPLLDLIECLLNFWKAENGHAANGQSALRLAVAFGNTSNGRPCNLYIDEASHLHQHNGVPVAKGSRSGGSSDGGAGSTEDDQLEYDVTEEIEQSRGAASGMVLVTPVPVRRDDPDLARDLLAGSHKPILGVISYS